MPEESGTGAEPVSAADRLAAEIRRRRRAAGLSQRELARLCGYTREYISVAERLGANVPSRELVRTLDHVLDADGTLVTLRSHATDEQRAKRVTPGRPPRNPISSTGYAVPCSVRPANR